MKYAPPQGWFGLRKPTPPYSALVAKDGSTVWAEDASGKTIASGESGEDDASVIQSALNTVSDGRIVLKRAEYSLSEPIKISLPKRLIIEGEGYNTVLRVENDSAGFEIVQTAFSTSNLMCKFKDLRVVGDRSSFPNAKGIYLKYEAETIRRVLLENVEFSSLKTALHVESLTLSQLSNIFIDNCENGIFFDVKYNQKIYNINILHLRTAFDVDYPLKCVVTTGNSAHLMLNVVGNEIGHRKCAVYFEGAGWSYPIQLVKFIGLNFESNKDTTTETVYMKYTQRVSFDRCSIHGGVTTVNNRQAYLESCYDISFRDCYIGAWGDNTNEAGLYLSGGEHIQVSGGVISGFTYPIKGSGQKKLALQLSNVYMQNLPENIEYMHKNCYFYIGGEYKYGENSGTATFSGDGSTTDFEIGAHGLVITAPSKIAVRVTPASSDAIAASPCVGYVDPADNTKIRVKFSSAPASGDNNVQIVWHAEIIS